MSLTGSVVGSGYWALRLILALASGLALFFESACVRADETPSLARIRRANLGAIQALTSFHCRFEVLSASSEKGLHVTERAEYWRLGDSFALRSTRMAGDFSENFSLAFSDSIVTTFTDEVRNGTRRAYGSVYPRADRALDEAWGKGLFAFYGPGPAWFTLDELLDKVRADPPVDLQIFDGKSYPHITVRQDVVRQEFWFDPAANYLVKALATTETAKNLNPTSRRTTEVQVRSFRELRPGVFFPERVEAHKVSSEGRSLAYRVEFSDARADYPVPSSVFKVRFPKDTEVSDQIQEKVFLTGSDGSLREVAGKHPTKIAPLSSSPILAGPSNSEEPRRARWLLPASLLLIFLGVAGWAWRRGTLMAGRGPH